MAYSKIFQNPFSFMDKTLTNIIKMMLCMEDKDYL